MNDELLWFQQFKNKISVALPYTSLDVPILGFWVLLFLLS